MLTLSQAQVEQLAQVPRETFLTDIAAHLNATWRLRYPEHPCDFLSPSAREMLRAQLRFLLDRGLSTAHDLASALEFINIFSVEPRQPPLRDLLKQSALSAAEKLEALARAAGVQGAQ